MPLDAPAHPASRLRSATRRAIGLRNLDREETAAAVAALLDERCGSVDAAAFLVALADKGATGAEIAGAADAVLAAAGAARPVASAVDIVGTGGDGLGTANISTIAALIAAAAGATVAKAGNRAATGSCGSADVLQALAVDIDPGLERIPALLREDRFAFVYTPAVHPAVARLAPLRRTLKRRTIFNLTGPLTNPFVTHARVIGASAREDQEALAEAASLLGFSRTWVVHSSDGMDELSASAEADAIVVHAGRIARLTVTPADLPLARAGHDALRGGDPRRNAALAEAVLSGRAQAALADTCALNAAALLHAGGHAADVADGLDAARAAVADGRAAALLRRLRRPTT
jgi:anthranilate phosphoribosyltransferase